MWSLRYNCQNSTLYLFLEQENEYSQKTWIPKKKEGGELTKLDLDKENPEFSLHALIGSHNPKTMRVKEKIVSTWVIILIDAASNYNFLNLAIVTKIGSPECHLNS